MADDAPVTTDNDEPKNKAGSRLKGLFKKKSKSDAVEMPPSRADLEESIEMDHHGLRQPTSPYHVSPAAVTAAGAPLEQHKSSSLEMTKAIMYKVIGSAQKPHPVENEYGEPICELRPLKPRHPCRMSMVLNVLFVAGIIAGIVMSAMSSTNHRLAVIGPVILGLSCFGFVGKIFFSVFWNDTPFPQVGKVMNKAQGKMYGETYVQKGHVNLGMSYSPSSTHSFPQSPMVSTMTSSQPVAIPHSVPEPARQSVVTTPSAMTAAPPPADLYRGASDSDAAARMATRYDPYVIDDAEQPRDVSTPTPLGYSSDEGAAPATGKDRIAYAGDPDKKKKCSIM